MRSPAFGLAWLFWTRHRLVLSAYFGYTALVAVLMHLSPAGSARERMIVLTLPLMAGLPVLLSVFSHPEADISSTASGYPTHLLVLPVRTRALALWPVALGGVTMAVAWLLIGGLIFRAVAPTAPLVWPALLLTALSSSLQSLMWTPFRVPYMRAGLAIVTLPGLIIGGVAAHQSGVPEGTISAFFLAVTIVCAWLAQVGLARARHDDGMERAWKADRAAARDTSAAVSPVEPARPFGSAFRAQVWLEWVRNGPYLPLITLILLVLASGLLVAVAMMDPAGWGSAKLGPFVDVQPAIYLKIIPGALGIPIWLAMTLGSGARKTDTRAKDFSIHPFLATRPLSSAWIVLAKAAACAMSAVAAWAVMVVFLFAWSFLPAHEGSAATTVGRIVWSHATPAGVLTAAGVLLFLIVWTVRNQVCGLFLDLTGRAWIVNGAPVTMATVVTVLLYVGALYLPDPENQQRMLRLAPIILGYAAGIKLVIDLVTFAALWRSRLMPARWLAVAAAGWVLMALLLFAGVRYLVPAALMPPWQAALAVFLWLPCARLALAPLSLHWNRHR